MEVLTVTVLIGGHRECSCRNSLWVYLPFNAIILMKCIIEFNTLVSLKWCFQTEDKVFFVMEFMKGGELFFHRKDKRRFSEEHVQFYGAEIGLGLD